MKKYTVRLWDLDNKICFQREGNFKDDSDALYHIDELPYSRIHNAVNYAFALSGGLTRNRRDTPSYSKITLTNKTDQVTNIYHTQTINNE